MKLAAAIAVVAVAFAAAVLVHQRTTSAAPAGWTCYAPKCAVKHEAWQDPVAALLALAGIAIAAGILIAGRRPPRLAAQSSPQG